MPPLDRGRNGTTMSWLRLLLWKTSGDQCVKMGRAPRRSAAHCRGCLVASRRSVARRCPNPLPQVAGTGPQPVGTTTTLLIRSRATATSIRASDRFGSKDPNNGWAQGCVPAGIF